MTLSEFELMLQENMPPDGLTQFLKALWFDAKENWQRAHEIVQEIETEEGSWMHAYLHRKEGDDTNARYWYSRAGKNFPISDLQEEWKQLTVYFLEKEEKES